MKIFKRLLTFVYFFFAMGFSYGAFTAPTNISILAHIMFAGYFVVRTGDLFRESWLNK